MVKVLASDDDYLEGKVIQMLLEKERPIVTEFCYTRSGRTAVEIARTMKPDIAFLDVQMPGLDGIATVEQLKLLNPNIKIAMISAHSDSEYILKTMKAGASDYILKPARPQEIIRVFDKLIKSDAIGDSGLLIARIRELIQNILSGQRSEALRILDLLWQEVIISTDQDNEKLRIRTRGLATYLINSISDRHHSPEILILLHNSMIRSINSAPVHADFKGYLIELIDTCLQLLDQYANDAGHELISQAHSYIQKNLQRNITLEDVARHIHLSTFYFSRLFKDKTGVNYIDYLIQLRLEKAKLLLLTTNDSVAVVAKKVGYSETNSFSRLFKSRLGISPSEYRAKNKSPNVIGN